MPGDLPGFKGVEGFFIGSSSGASDIKNE